MGRACCIQVRATAAVRRWRPARAVKPSTARLRSATSSVDHCPQLEHQGGIDHILAGRSPVYVSCCGDIGLGHLGSQRPDQRDRDIARHGCLFSQGLGVIAFGAGGSGDMIGGERRYDAECGLRACERDLEVEHALQARAVIHDGAHGRARDQRGQQRRWRERVGHCGTPGGTPIAARSLGANPHEDRAVQGSCGPVMKAFFPSARRPIIVCTARAGRATASRVYPPCDT